MLQTKQWQQNFSFGGRLPWGVGLLLALTVSMSLVTAFLGRHAAPLVGWVALVPSEVWHGQLWRLATWPFVDASPLWWIFACLGLYWFGSPLAQRWGSPRFLVIVGGGLVAAAIGTCLIALVDAEVMVRPYLGTGAMITGLIVLWGLTFPDLVVRIYFVLPIRGYWMAWGTVAVTVVYAIYMGWAGFLPELLAEAAVLAWLFRTRLFARWSRPQRARGAPRRAAERSTEPRRRGVVVDLRTGEPTEPGSSDNE
jgi:membrane associated rhomboid family serine protease